MILLRYLKIYVDILKKNLNFKEISLLYKYININTISYFFEVYLIFNMNILFSKKFSLIQRNNFF